MGDEVAATKGLSVLASDQNKVRKYFDDWNDDQIIGGSGSKNIPLLKFAHDLVVADRKNDSAMLDKCRAAYRGYFAACRKHGHFLGEEYSTIYWRWIVTPVWLARCVARKRGWVEGVVEADKWLTDFVVICSLAAWPTLHYYESKYGKTPHKLVFGIPCTVIGLARSWVFNKGADGVRTWDDSMSWVDATNHAPWLAWVLGKAPMHKLGGGDGWTREMWIKFSAIYSDVVKPVITDAVKQELLMALDHNMYPQKLVDELQYGPTKPIVIGKTANGVWCVGERCFTDGSTSFMHSKVLLSNELSYHVYGIANPVKRTNPHHGSAIFPAGWRSAQLIADDGMVVDMEQQKMVKGTVDIYLPFGEIFWVVRLVRGKAAERLDKTPEPQPDDGDDSGGWFRRLIRKIVSWLVDLFD